jgi:hypothetical protein
MRKRVFIPVGSLFVFSVLAQAVFMLIFQYNDSSLAHSIRGAGENSSSYSQFLDYAKEAVSPLAKFDLSIIVWTAMNMVLLFGTIIYGIAE